MSLTVGFNYGPNDIAEAPQAKLTGGPHHGSIVELESKDCHALTVTVDGTPSIYINTHNTNRDNQHIFLYECTE